MIIKVEFTEEEAEAVRLALLPAPSPLASCVAELDQREANTILKVLENRMASTNQRFDSETPENAAWDKVFDAGIARGFGGG